MNTTARRVTALIGAIAATATMTATAPAGAATLAPSRITVHATDTTPASGQLFRLQGAVLSSGETVPATVRVKTFRTGRGCSSPDAVVKTNRDNRYNLGVRLQMKGQRLLRVIGDPVGSGHQHRTQDHHRHGALSRVRAGTELARADGRVRSAGRSAAPPEVTRATTGARPRRPRGRRRPGREGSCPASST